MRYTRSDLSRLTRLVIAVTAVSGPVRVLFSKDDVHLDVYDGFHYDTT